MKIRKIIGRWTKREESALSHQFHGKSADDRFRGLRRSERNEAKLFILAFAPAILTTPFIGKWSDASFLGKSIMVASGLWMIGVLLVGGYLLFRSIYRTTHK
ncbi:hypothetical protein [Sphingopyxis macrogoltabida]|uniref:hypothetical protein n=1 Tax=Sphingopyxis macrogoltabida TaxID=33050 RepID=UPI0011AB39E4|nr:hypothetical protein [Sphingopyxis macrogoltabida]